MEWLWGSKFFTTLSPSDSWVSLWGNFFKLSTSGSVSTSMKLSFVNLLIRHYRRLDYFAFLYRRRDFLSVFKMVSMLNSLLSFSCPLSRNLDTTAWVSLTQIENGQTTYPTARRRISLTLILTEKNPFNFDSDDLGSSRDSFFRSSFRCLLLSFALDPCRRRRDFSPFWDLAKKSFWRMLAWNLWEV